MHCNRFIHCYDFGRGQSQHYQNQQHPATVPFHRQTRTVQLPSAGLRWLIQRCAAVCRHHEAENVERVQPDQSAGLDLIALCIAFLRVFHRPQISANREKKLSLCTEY